MKNLLFIGLLLGALAPGTSFAQERQLRLDSPQAAPSQGLTLQRPSLNNDVPDTQAAEIVDIQVQGNRRVEAESILDRVRTQSGERLDREKISEDIRRIFELGYFEDIQVDAEEVGPDQVRLTFIVSENPAIDAIHFVGNSALDDEKLLEEVGLKRYSILDINQINASAEAIRELYHREGYYLAEVSFEVEEQAGRPDLAEVTFQIQEHSKVRVKRVTFLGNENIESQQLKRVMATQEGNWLSFLSKMGSFQEEDFELDLQRLTLFYYNEGYVQVQVHTPSIRLSADKRDLYITIRIDEGPQHYVSEVDVRGDLLIDREEMLEMIQLDDEGVFRYGIMQEDALRLTRLYQDAGYANARVTPLPGNINPETNEVDVTFDIQKGELVYVGRIEIVGNTKTRDQVIRRELQIEEGQLYSASAVESSRARVQRLGYFEEVTLTSQQTQSPEVMDLRIEVVEQPTGTFQLGAGLSSQESFIFQGQISQQNLFGRGQSLELSVQASRIRQLFNLRFIEPRLLGSQWYFATDLYNFDYLYQDFGRLSRGGTLSVGYPIGLLLPWSIDDALTASVRYKLESVKVTPGGITGSLEQPASPLFADGMTSSFRLSTAYDTRDNRLFPTSGSYHNASVELADTLFLSENEFVKYDAEVRWYKPLIWNFVLRLNASLGYVTTTNPEQPVPVFERYFVGGPETVRGFERYTLGPARRVPVASEDPAGGLRDFHYGGNKQLILTAEVEFPIFAAAHVRGVIFADAGNAFGDGVPLTLRPDLFADDVDRYSDALRTAVGVGVRWFSPIGPLRFEWGVPLQRLPGERPLVFDFSITNAF